VIYVANRNDSAGLMASGCTAIEEYVNESATNLEAR